jgi:hypothetical protein
MWMHILRAFLALMRKGLCGSSGIIATFLISIPLVARVAIKVHILHLEFKHLLWLKPTLNAFEAHHLLGVGFGGLSFPKNAIS